MVTIWSFYSIMTSYLIYAASRNPLYKEVPSWVYGWFNLVYKMTWGLIVGGTTMILLEFFGVVHLVIAITQIEFIHKLVGIGGLCLFYGFYFGVLGRDCAEMCTDRLASVMGYTGKGIPSKNFGCSYMLHLQ